jgi:hypothetical protein
MFRRVQLPGGVAMAVVPSFPSGLLRERAKLMSAAMF